jgi:pSer/pThr/pTyr-binding forkhead associated (FHA) protein
MKVVLYLLKKNGEIRPFQLPSTVTLIGRRQDCDLCIPLTVISRKHCELNMDQGRLMIRDLKSKNCTYVNGQKIEETRLNPGDQIGLGPLTFIVQIDGQPAEIAGIKPIEPKHEPIEKGDMDKPASESHFDEFMGDLANASLSESHKTEIQDFAGDNSTFKDM